MATTIKNGVANRETVNRGFLQELMGRIVGDIHETQTGNVDRLRFGRGRFPQRLFAAAFDHTFAHLRKTGLCFMTPGAQAQIEARLALVVGQQEQFEWLYGSLADNDSRRLLVSLVAFRVLGARHVKLPLNESAYWQKVASIEQDFLTHRNVAVVPILGQIHEYDLAPLGKRIRLQAHPLNVLNTFLLQQYRFHRPSAPTIEARPGDIVVDGGACWGDTTLYFAEKVGATGRVIAYEFLPENLRILERNLAMNPDLSSRVTLEPRALWNRPGERIGFSSQGSASRIVEAPADGDAGSTAMTATIDELAAKADVPRVDFIKLDIEGAEPEALEGAAQVIGKFRPRLAISVYHRLEHLWQIARWIDGLELGYRFYIDHYTIHAEETVLFAEA